MIVCHVDLYPYYFQGQAAIDVADGDIVKLLEELKAKQQSVSYYILLVNSLKKKGEINEFFILKIRSSCLTIIKLSRMSFALLLRSCSITTK